MIKRTDTFSKESQQVITVSSGRQLPLTRPLIMGILNVTPDSFSDGGRFINLTDAVAHALKMVDEGADIIDIGGESTRPGADPVSAEEEIRRVIPVIEMLKRETDIPISIDTYKASTAQAALEAGADIVNDVSALRFDSSMANLIASQKVPVVLMHMLGTPRDMQKNPHYENCVEEIAQFFVARIDFCIKSGIEKTKIILDPGIGFGKRLSDNLEILANLRRFKEFSLPLLVGVSRKSFIGMIHTSGCAADQRIGGSIAATVAAVINGADIVRVHDVAQTVEALKVLQAIRETA
ncbi:MAG: dihydropteroate synthase [Candidatus Zixiibacteriota bacterium]